MNNSDMKQVLKRIALFTGIAALAISIYFSYDGFDQSVNGTNEGYTGLAVVIGLTLAIIVSVVQFIFGTSYDELNWTLIAAGVGAYIYSIYTNYLGIKHVLGADEFMAGASALFLDIYPEPAIAWALGESLVGDLLGNLGKAAFGIGGKEKNRPQPYQQQFQGVHQSKRERAEQRRNSAKQVAPTRANPEKQDREPTYHPISYRE